MRDVRKKCSVLGCNSDSATNNSLKFFLFPKTAVCSEWIQACENSNLNNLSLSTLTHKRHVCSLHFTDNDYAFKFSPFKSMLRKGAIPTRNLSFASAAGK